MEGISQMRSFFRLALSCLGLLAVGCLASAEVRYRLVPIYGHPGDVFVGAMGLNDNGDVVGVAGPNGRSDAFIFRGGVMTFLTRPQGASYVQANAISDSGMIVGWSDNSSYQGLRWDSSGNLIYSGSDPIENINYQGHFCGFRYSSPYNYGYVSDGNSITGFGPGSGVPRAINNNDLTVGVYYDSALQANEVYFWNQGIITYAPLLEGCSQVSPRAVNDLGDAVGACWGNSTPTKACLWHNQQPFPLPGLPGPTRSEATGINNRNEIVGDSTDTTTQIQSAWIYRNGVTTDLNRLTDGLGRQHILVATAINQRGWITVEVDPGAGSTSRIGGLLIPVNRLPLPGPTVSH
ncbi:MAG TPA: hypothetical protein VHE55_00870 [Fimbriimonadaceae bacterium]|nr:hypothetical protein [Fimbriimonadaceae bacterium]